MNSRRTAAFFRVEGPLVSRGTLAASAYIAANGRNLADRARRLGALALSAPVFGLLGQNDRTTANRMAWMSLRHMTEDRVAVLGEEYVGDSLKSHVLQSGVELVRQARRAGHHVVLLSEGIREIAEPLSAELGQADEILSNRLEYRSGECTGRLLSPVLGGNETVRWVKRYAEENDIDLSQSLAYGAHGPDMLLLAAVGKPCAVNPDYTLRRAAEEADWPVVYCRD